MNRSVPEGVSSAAELLKMTPGAGCCDGSGADWEFSTRLGVDKSNARALRTELGDLIARLPPE